MSDQWIVMRNWERFQHRDVSRSKDSAPIWIRNYTRLLHNEDYLSLSWQQRGVLHGLWMEYAASDGQLPDSTATLSRRLGDRVMRATLERLNHAGFIAFSASKPPRLSASLEQNREEKNPPTPLGKGGEAPLDKNGQPRKLTKRDLARYTGCKHTRGTHGFGHKHTPLGQDPPPKDWPHPAPTEPEIAAALNAAREFVAHMEDTT